MRNDFSFAASVREEANEFYKIISSKNLLLMQYFFLDTLAHMSYKSLEMQTQYRSVITGQKLINDLVFGTERLKYQIGEHTKNFLTNFFHVEQKIDSQ